jgi:hypothetical protein
MGFKDTNKEVFEELIRTKQISILLVDDNKVNQFLGKRSKIKIWKRICAYCVW